MARRRRYNRKRRKGNFAFLYKLLAFVLICGAIGLALAMFFRIDDIEISGNSRYSNEQIAAAAQIKAGDNLFFLNKYDAAARIRQQLPYVETVQFRRVLPSKLVVQVIDLSDAARITMQYMGRFQVEFLWDADFNYKLDYLAAVVEKLEANEKGTIDMTQDGKASFIPS